MSKHAALLTRIEQQFGVPGGVVIAIWALETDFGAVQGDFNTRNALVTLSHDCRRPELFRPQLLGLIEMVKHGDLDSSLDKASRELDVHMADKSVGGAGQTARRLRREGAYLAWIFFMLFAISIAIIIALTCRGRPSLG